jgi:hypothetical protein
MSMLSVSFLVLLFFGAIVAAMLMREQVRDNKGVRAWYERMVKDRLDLLKKIVIYGTLVLWAGIWLATRGDEKLSVGSLLQEFSNSWTKQESQAPLPVEKE